MKELLLARHAKSGWDDASLRDIDRPLNARGLKDAPEMGRRLRERGLRLDLIVSSPARRALRTAQSLAEELGYAVANIEIKDDLYEASEDIWLRTIREIPARCNSALIVGHNPEITAVANRLTRSHIANVPTCGILHVQYAARNWDRFDRTAPQTWDFDYPKRR